MDCQQLTSQSLLENRCRVCLNQFPKVKLQNILEDSAQNIKINDAFYEITSIRNLDDGHLICSSCLLRLISAFEFRLEALSSTTFLEKLSRDQTNGSQPQSPEIKVEMVFEQDDDGYWPIEPETDVFLKCPSQFGLKNESKVSEKTVKKKSITKKAKVFKRCRFCLNFLENGLWAHEKQHIAENEGLECHHCGKKYLKRSMLLEHLLRNHFFKEETRQRYACDLCDKTYTEKSAVRSHKKSFHFGIVKQITTFVCNMCGKEQKGKYALEKHIDMVHNNVIVGFCNECGKGFKTKVSLLNHLKFVHLKLRPYQCRICLKGYIHRLELKRHMTGVHTNERAFSCITCNKKFKTEAILKNHVKLHTNDFSYPCQICGMTFKTLSYVKAHMKAHSDECFFFCKLCPKKFKRSGQLTKHMRLHSGNLFFCSQCQTNGFVDKFTLDEHIERVHIGVKYRCGTCGKEYGCRKHLRQHQNAQFHDRSKWTKIDPRYPEMVVNLTA